MSIDNLLNEDIDLDYGNLSKYKRLDGGMSRAGIP